MSDYEISLKAAENAQQEANKGDLFVANRAMMIKFIAVMVLIVGSITVIAMEANDVIAKLQLTNKLPVTIIKSTSKPPVIVKSTDIIYRDDWQAPIVLEGHKLIFFHIAKVGSTNWKKLCRRMLGYKNWFEMEPHYPSINGLVTLNHYNTSQATELMNSPDYTRAIFLRDPKDRVLSGFLDKIIAKQWIRCCLKTEVKCLEKLRTFSGFVHLLSECRLGCCHDEHWKPYSERMEGKYISTLNFVGHQETVHEDAKRLLQQVGAWEMYGKSGWGEYGNESFMESKSDVVHKTNALDHWAQYYTPVLERVVESMYAGDYKLFNLPNEKHYI